MTGKGEGRLQTRGSRGLLVVELSFGEIRTGGSNSVLRTVALTIAEPVACGSKA